MDSSRLFSAAILVVVLVAPACVPDQPTPGDAGSADAGSSTDTVGEVGPGEVGPGDIGGGDTSDATDVVEPVEIEVETGCNPLATSDDCLLPYPSTFHQKPDDSTPTGVTTQIPEEALPAAEEGTLSTDFVNTSDGASPAAPILVHFGFDIDLGPLPKEDDVASSVEGQPPVVLFDMTDGERVPYFAEMDQNRKEDESGRYAFIIRPVRPLDPGHRYAVAMTKELESAGDEAIESPAAFRALRDGIPTTSDRVEAVRGAYEEIFSFLGEHGYPRSKLRLAWDFRVASEQWVLDPALSVREAALEYAEETSLEYNISNVAYDPNEDVARIVEGTFEVPSFINDDHAIEWGGDREPDRQEEDGSYQFTMIVPEKASSEGPLPLTVFGHGLFGSGRNYLTGDSPAETIHEFAQSTGTVVIATEWVGLSDDDVEVVREELLSSLNRVEVVTDRLLQSLVNNLVMTEVAQGPLNEASGVKIEGESPIDANRTWYYGVSLGGIQGTSFVALSPDVTNGVFSVGGAMWATMLSRSSNWKRFQPALELQYPDPLLRRVAVQLMQYYFDQVDPANLGRLLLREPLEGTPERNVLYHEAIGDTQVPNLTTRALARGVGLKLVTPAVDEPYGLETVAAPTTEPVLTQYHLPEQTEGSMPPNSNVPPEEDNGVHSDILFLDHLQQQIDQFVTSGEVEQYCSGPCDPD